MPGLSAPLAGGLHPELDRRDRGQGYRPIPTLTNSLCPAHRRAAVVHNKYRFSLSSTPFPKESDMKILYINNDGGGFADHIEVATDTTVAALFEQRLPACKPQDYLIRVNRQPASSDQVLREGDRVSMTPVKIEGAA